MKYLVVIVAWLKSVFSKPTEVPLTIITPKVEAKMNAISELIEGVKYLIGLKAKHEKKIMEQAVMISTLQKHMSEDLAEIAALNDAIRAAKEALADVPTIPSDGGGASMGGIETGNSMAGIDTVS